MHVRRSQNLAENHHPRLFHTEQVGVDMGLNDLVAEFIGRLPDGKHHCIQFDIDNVSDSKARPLDVLWASSWGAHREHVLDLAVFTILLRNHASLDG